MTPRTAEALQRRYGASYKWLASGAVMVGCIATVLSATIVNVALPDIMGEFGLGQDQAQWLSTAFLAAMTASMLTTAWGLATFGTKKAYVYALAVFVVGSILGGVSPNEHVLIVARVLQGAAAGLVQPVAMVVLFTSFHPSERGLAMGLYSLGVVLAPALGPTMGGMLVDNYTWRYVFFLGIPLCLAGAGLAMAYLPDHVRRDRMPFDLPGFVLLCILVFAFLTALSNGQREGWDSLFVRGFFGLSALATVGFILRERTCATPLLALGVYANPRFLAASLVAFILGLGLFGSTYLIPLFVQTIQGASPTESGLLLMPGGIVLGLVSPVAGRLADRVPPYVLIMVGLALFGWSSWLMTAADTSTAFWSFAGWVVLGRVGLGCILPSLNSGALRVLSHEQVGQGSGNINFMRQLGGAVGVSLLSVYLERQTTLYGQALNALQTGTHIASDTLVRIGARLMQAGFLDDFSQSLRQPEAYQFFSNMLAAKARMMGFRESFLLAALLFALGIVPAWFMRLGRSRTPNRPR